MMRLGAHVSVAGGLHNAIPAAIDIGADTFQMFSKNQRQWIAKPLTDEEITAFKEPLSKTELCNNWRGSRGCGHQVCLCQLPLQTPH